MFVCITYLSPHSPQAKTNKLNKSCKVVGEKALATENWYSKTK